MTIAVDAMGGDLAPGAVVQGSLEAARQFGVSIILAGDEAAISREMEKSGLFGRQLNRLISIKHCTQAADMNDPPVEVLRHKKDASVRVAFDLVKSGQAMAAVSAGNSGATLAVASVVLGRLEGLERPGIASILPTVRGRTIVIDVGANVDCRPKFLFQFGVMAEAYARAVFKIDRPRVALLSIGEEDSKGNTLVRQAHDLFRAGPLNFIGNIEGRDLFLGQADVVVCDGFVGNVVLKLSEAMAEVAGGMLEQELDQAQWPKISAFFLRKAFKNFQKKIDYAEFGGAPLLGVRGTGIISHGRSSPLAVKNAIRTAIEFIGEQMPQQLQERLNETRSLLVSSSKTES